jgi:WD40 repeat protein
VTGVAVYARAFNFFSFPDLSVTNNSTARIPHPQNMFVGSYKYAPNGRIHVTTETNGTVHVVEWRADSIQNSQFSLGHPDFGSLLFSPDSKALFSSDYDRHVINRWDTKTWEPVTLSIPILDDFTNFVRRLYGFSPDGRSILIETAKGLHVKPTSDISGELPITFLTESSLAIPFREGQCLWKRGFFS